MKSYLKFCATVIALVVIYGLLAPMLISGGTEMVVMGVVLMIVAPLGVVVLYRKKEVKGA